MQSRSKWKEKEAMVQWARDGGECKRVEGGRAEEKSNGGVEGKGVSAWGSSSALHHPSRGDG